MADLKAIKCPTCGKRGAWFDGQFGPFCSKRCRLIDLGKWFLEEHKISESLPDAPESDENLPPS